MKRKNSIVLLIGWLAFAVAPGHAVRGADGSAARAVAQQVGTISGRVQNVVTGKYLNKARVSVKGTDRIAYTDEFGTYRFVDVPAGATTLEVFYTDLDVQEIQVAVTAGATLERNVELTSIARYGQNGAVVKLDPFLVSSDKETDAQAIATNEQRFAPNIKNVISTDSVGDVLGSNLGEFLKFIPGLTAEYSQVEIVGISIRGIGGAMTSFTADGTAMVSAFFGGGRDFNVNSLAINDIARIEVTKVPTPSTPADSLAGSINMVSKSAFERSRAQFRYGLNLVANSENLTFSKTPHSNGDKKTRKILPGFDFDYTQPIGKNFGFVLTGMQSNKFNEQHLSIMNYNTVGTATGASIGRPYLQSHTLLDGPRNQTRNTLNFKADWRVTPHSVLSLGSQLSRYDIVIGTLSWATDTGAVGTPRLAEGIPFSYGNDYTIGASGRGNVNMTGGAQTFQGGTTAANLNYRFDDGKWKIEASISKSVSDIVRRNQAAGQFGGFTAIMNRPVRVTFSNINKDRPGAVQVFDESNREADIYDINNYRATSANDSPYTSDAGIRTGSLSVRRSLNVLPFPASIQIGGVNRVQTLDVRAQSRGWTYNGPDGNPLTFDSPAPYLMQVYKNQDSHYGFKNIPWISPSRAWSAFQANPILFSQTEAQVVSQESFRVTNSEYIREEVSAFFLQAEASLFKSRLKLLTGVRFEKTTGEGQGSLFNPNSVYVRKADGSFARDSVGNRILKPEANSAVAREQLSREERSARTQRTYEGYYPSLHLNYSIKENFLARAAYAKTYGRPNFTDIIPRTVINERDLRDDQLDDPAFVRGDITVRNANLRPWTADNYDLSLEYYTKQGGLFSAGVFLKEIKDFFGSAVRLATLADLEEVGLDPRYVGWNLSTKFNSGDARILGAEFNLRHSLRELGRWGSYFTVFANATKLKLEGHQQASFTSFIPESGNWGASFSRKQITATARWNYRGLDKRVAQPRFGPDGFQYFKARTTLDLSLAYQLTSRLSLAGSVNNVFNVAPIILMYGSQTPAYARQNRTEEFGIAIAIGLKGTF